MEPREVLGVDAINLSDPLFWARPMEEREGGFATLRRERPISFHEEPYVEGLPFPRGPGYWALTRHADILEVSRNPQTFCSGQGSNIGDLPPDFAEFFGSMINMDDPGPHFCLGAHLARREITVMFRELFRAMPDIHVVGEPHRLQSFFIHGIKRMRCEWRA